MTHFNGPSAPHLQDLASKLRQQFRNSQAGLNDEVLGFTVGGQYYERHLDGTFVDLLGNILDLDKLLRAPDGPQPDGPLWDHPIDAPAYLDWEALYGTPIPKQEWVVPGWIPRWETTGLGGAGGEGKTLLAQMLATAGSIGMPWLEIDLPFFKTYAILCEDHPEDTRRRQEKINRHFGCTERDLSPRLRVWPRRRNKHNYLMIFDRDGIGHPTNFFHQVIAEVKAFKADLVILDTKSDLFFGNQNDEHQARTFVRQCTDAIAEATGSGVLLIYHPSRSGMIDGTGQSGSVQWDGAFRGRLVLTTPEPEEGSEQAPDDDARVLTRIKSNFAKRGETIEMRWDDGVFIRTDAPAVDPSYVANAKRDKRQRVFLELLDQCHKTNRNLSDCNTGSNYAPKVMATMPDRQDVTRKQFEVAMAELFGTSKIVMEERARRRMIVHVEVVPGG